QTGNLKILDESHYYPFGLKHQKYQTLGLVESANQVIIAPIANNPFKYSYNNTEWQDELGWNMYDMDMRQYDPAIARWVVMDPVIHHSLSPYNAFDNNPEFWADPSGANSLSWLDEIYKKSQSGDTWTNDGNGNFENDRTGETSEGSCPKCNWYKNTTTGQIDWFATSGDAAAYWQIGEGGVKDLNAKFLESPVLTAEEVKQNGRYIMEQQS